MTYSELKRFHRYITNELDIYKFTIILRAVNPWVEKEEVDKYFKIFQKDQIEFILSYTENMFNLIKIMMKEENYLGI